MAYSYVKEILLFYHFRARLNDFLHCVSLLCLIIDLIKKFEKLNKVMVITQYRVLLLST